MSIRMALALILSLGLLAACARPTPAPTPAPAAPPSPTPVAVLLPVPTPTPPPPPVVLRPTGELRIAMTELGAEVLNPTLGPAVAVKTPAMHIFDYLVGGTAQAQLSKEHGLARNWEVKHGSKSSTYTFKLRQGVKFHNGDEVTAEDVKFSLEYFMRPGSVASYAGTLRKVIERIELPDRYTVVIHTKAPYGLLLDDLSPLGATEGMVLPKRYLEEKGEDYFNKNPIGSGPYRFKEQVIGSYIRYEALNQHWLYGVPKYKTVTLFQVPKEATRIAMLKTGQADAIDISRERVKELVGFNTFLKIDSTTVTVWMLQQWQPDTFLSDKRVREALNIALNREEILKFIFAGQGQVSADGWYGSWSIGYKSLPLYPYAPERAKALLKEAFPAGVSLTLNSYNRPGLPELMRMNEAVVGMWDKVGVKTKIVPMDYGTHRPLQAKKTLPNTVVGMGGDFNRSTWTATWRILFHSTGLLALTHDPKLDALIEAAEGEIDLTRFGERQYEAAKYMRDNFLIVPVVSTGPVWSTNPRKITQWNLGKRLIDFNTLDLIQRR